MAQQGKSKNLEGEILVLKAKLFDAGEELGNKQRLVSEIAGKLGVQTYEELFERLDYLIGLDKTEESEDS